MANNTAKSVTLIDKNTRDYLYPYTSDSLVKRTNSTYETVQEALDALEAGEAATNRAYDSTKNAKGYMVLNPDNPASQLEGKDNYIIEVRDIIDLNGGTLTMRSGCVLKFLGGKFINGTINFGNTKIDADDIQVFEDITIAGCSSTQEVKSVWFGLKSGDDSYTKNSQILQNLIDSFRFVYINPGSYYMTDPIIVKNEDDDGLMSRIRILKGDGSHMGLMNCRLIFNSSDGFIVRYRDGDRIIMDGVSLQGSGKGTFNSETRKFEGGYIGLYLYTGLILRRCEISSWMVGVEKGPHAIVTSTFDRCLFSSNGNYGVHFDTYGSDDSGDPKTGNVIGTYIVDCYFNNTGYKNNDHGKAALNQPSADSTGKKSGIGLYFRGGSGNTIINNVFEYNSGIGLFIDRPTDNTKRYSGMVIIGNDFEYNKWSNLFIDLNSDSSVKYAGNFIVKGNSYSDAIWSLPSDAQKNRGCNVLDTFGNGRRNNNIYDNVDETLFLKKYNCNPLLLDMDLYSIYNSSLSVVDWTNKCISLNNDNTYTYLIYAHAILSQGVYNVIVNAKVSANRSSRFYYRLPGDSSDASLLKSISASDSYSDVSYGFISIPTSGTLFRPRSIRILSPDGATMQIKSIRLEKVTQMTTSQRLSITPYSGCEIYDTTLNKTFHYINDAWVSETSDSSGSSSTTGGTTEERLNIDPNLYSNLEYYDTDLKQEVFLSKSLSPSLAVFQAAVKSDSSVLHFVNPLEEGKYYKITRAANSTNDYKFYFRKDVDNTEDEIKIFDGASDINIIWVKAPDPSVYKYIYVYNPTNLYTHRFNVISDYRWLDSNGFTVAEHKGTTAERLSILEDGILHPVQDERFPYFDTDLNQTVYYTTKVNENFKRIQIKSTDVNAGGAFSQNTLSKNRIYTAKLVKTDLPEGSNAYFRAAFTTTNDPTDSNYKELPVVGYRIYTDYVNIIAPDPTVYPYIKANATSGSANTYVVFDEYESSWIGEDGFTPAVKRGTTLERPTLTASDGGFQYYDTDLNKYICWNGSTWINLDGTALT